MSFIVSGLEAGEFAHLFGKSDEELRAVGACAYVADGHPGFPCRVALKDVEPGTRVILLNYAHLNVPTPYNSRHAIFVTDGAQAVRLEPDHVPEILSIREALSLRAFDRAHMMIDARVIPGAKTAETLDELLSDVSVSYIHAHTAGRGCFLARVDRV